MRRRYFTPFDIGIMVILIGIISCILLITTSSLPEEGIIRNKRLTQRDVKAIRGTEIAGLAYNNYLGEGTCLLRGLDTILVPRVSGSQGNIQVRDYLVRRIEELGWKSELDTFTKNDTIIGEVTFSNVIGISNPTAKKHVVFSAHFDSKLYPETADGKHFLGATDSAVPCAMILNIMDNLNEALMKQQKEDPDRGIIVVFFDGEEAFKDWTSTDSVYGSKHLAAKWEESGFFDKMELFILLDLIGAKDPIFTSSFENTRPHFTKLQQLEIELSGLGLLKGRQRNYFRDSRNSWGIDDDHKPFQNRGFQDIVHIISTPFPPQWHKMTDDAEHLDCATIHELLMVLQLWTAEMFSLHKLINM